MIARRILLAALLSIGVIAPLQAQSPLRADLGQQWRTADGQLRWPPNDGCADAPVKETLPPGTTIDRYGSDFGRFFAVPGTSFEARALPYDPGALPYKVYVVRQPLPVEECKIAAWFDEPGGGEQFKAAEPAAQLVNEGVIAPQ